MAVMKMKRHILKAFFAVLSHACNWPFLNRYGLWNAHGIVPMTF
jgi:hypothetical protein